MEGTLLAHQQTASVTKLIFGSFLTMLPTLSYGCVLSFATCGLPKMMELNKTGILLDIHQISWISELKILTLFRIKHLRCLKAELML